MVLVGKTVALELLPEQLVVSLQAVAEVVALELGKPAVVAGLVLYRMQGLRKTVALELLPEQVVVSLQAVAVAVVA
jgi:hypothetical protein